jgi:hypothetical protein
LYSGTMAATLPPLAEDFGMGCAVEQVGLTEA